VEIDLVVYSVAAPRRSHLGDEWKSAIVARGEPLEVVGLDFKSGEFKPITVDAASEIQLEHTRRVMGGDDLEMWTSALMYSGVAAEGMTVTALSYIGPELEALRKIYWDGALGAAKQHVDATTKSLDGRLRSAIGGRAFSVMNPAVVTSASVAIPAMVRYISDYLGLDADGQGVYDDPLSVGINFVDSLYGDEESWRSKLDEEGRLRLDQHELDAGLQQAISRVWQDAGGDAPSPITVAGLDRFRREYYQLYGWEVEGVDYESPCTVDPPLGERPGVVDLLSEV
jgi:enoyl-[acyl-carrier protein] reductase/trans-2-enoyl-CoA reductase (NAD+)